MNKNSISICVFVTAVALSLSLLAGCSFGSKTEALPTAEVPSTAVSPSPAAPSTTPSMSKDEIINTLKTYGDNAIDITLSPDDSAVAFIKSEEQASNVYVWKTGEENAKLVSVADPTTDGFWWSPNSKYFLINVGHMGPGTITSTLIDTETLEMVSSEISSVSVSPPVWSADSRFLALSTYADDGTANIYSFAVASKTSVSLLKSNSPFGPYVVESWGADNVVKYTEMTSTGARTEKIIELAE